MRDDRQQGRLDGHVEFAIQGFLVSDASQFQELIQRVRERDQDAARELTQRYEKIIRRVVRIHLRDARLRQIMDSMDVCQSVLATFFVRTALGQYELDSPENLINLLASIARNKLTNQVHRLQAQRRDLRKNTTLEGNDLHLADRASDPSEQASAREILEKVWGKLDESERYLAEQRSLGRSWKEIADEMGALDVTLRKKLTRSLDRALAEMGIDQVHDD